MPASVPGGRRFSDFLRGEVPWRNFFCLLLLLFLLLLERLEVLLVLLCAHLFGSAVARAVGILHGSGGAEESQDAAGDLFSAPQGGIPHRRPNHPS